MSPAWNYQSAFLVSHTCTALCMASLRRLAVKSFNQGQARLVNKPDLMLKLSLLFIESF